MARPHWRRLAGYGTVFKLDTTGKETVLYSFSGTGGDGADPDAGLVQDTQGNLYGTTYDWRRFRLWNGVQAGYDRQGDRAAQLHRDRGTAQIPRQV